MLYSTVCRTSCILASSSSTDGYKASDYEMDAVTKEDVERVFEYDELSLTWRWFKKSVGNAVILKKIYDHARSIYVMHSNERGSVSSYP